MGTGEKKQRKRRGRVLMEYRIRHTYWNCVARSLYSHSHVESGWKISVTSTSIECACPFTLID